MDIQSVIFSKFKWTIPMALDWLNRHGLIHYKVDETRSKYRFRQFDPHYGMKYRTIKLGRDSGIEYVLAYP
jgi:hypothetical protein